MDRESIQPGGRQQSTKTGIRSWTWLCLSRVCQEDRQFINWQL